MSSKNFTRERCPGGVATLTSSADARRTPKFLVDVELYSRLRIGAAIARGHPTEVAVAMSELAVLLDCWWNQSDKLAKEMVFEDVMACGSRDVDDWG
jgi:hypothetical protein